MGLLGLGIYTYAVLVSIITLLYLVIDVNYFLRIAWVIGYGMLFDKKKKVDETTEIHGICTSHDLDIFFTHMNNARYLRELDFARFHFYERTGLYWELRDKKGHILQTASNIRYRRTIPLWYRYKVTTKIVGWDDKNFYLEQQFITTHDGFVRAVILSKQGTTSTNVPEIMAKFTGKDVSYRPTPPAELEDWIKSMEKSSERLKKKD